MKLLNVTVFGEKLLSSCFLLSQRTCSLQRNILRKSRSVDMSRVRNVPFQILRLSQLIDASKIVSSPSSQRSPQSLSP